MNPMGSRHVLETNQYCLHTLTIAFGFVVFVAARLHDGATSEKYNRSSINSDGAGVQKRLLQPIAGRFS
jgi:hypothetical protein